MKDLILILIMYLKLKNSKNNLRFGIKVLEFNKFKSKYNKHHGKNLINLLLRISICKESKIRDKKN